MPARNAAHRLPSLQRLLNQTNFLVVTPTAPTFSAQHLHLHAFMTLRLDLRSDFRPARRTAQDGLRRSDTFKLTSQPYSSISCHVWTAPSWQGESSRCVAGRCSHVFGLFGAVHMTAGHNALRGSGPGQKPAFDNAMAHLGCPDRRIDRLCITCCSPSQPSHRAGYPARSRHAASATGSL